MEPGNNFDKELQFIASRSSGPGGQNVNKVNSRIELRFHVNNSMLLNDEEKELVQLKLKNRINSEGCLILVCQTERSQLKNKEKVRERFYKMITKALHKPKQRKASKPSKAAIEKRLDEKRQTSERKKRRIDSNHL